jgi:hypothetical protein
MKRPDGEVLLDNAEIIFRLGNLCGLMLEICCGFIDGNEASEKGCIE